MSVVNKYCFVPVYNCVCWKMELMKPRCAQFVIHKGHSLFALRQKFHSPCPLQIHVFEERLGENAKCKFTTIPEMSVPTLYLSYVER